MSNSKVVKKNIGSLQMNISSSDTLQTPDILMQIYKEVFICFTQKPYGLSYYTDGNFGLNPIHSSYGGQVKI